MSAAAPTAEVADVVPAKKGKKKLIIMVAAALALLLAVGGAGLFVLKKRHAAEAAEAGASAGAEDAHHGAKPDLKHPPTFLPLDPFIVNLADKDADRYAQVGITFEVEDAKFADQLKVFMPAIRNGILMILAHKTSRELLERSGKERLAGQVQREAARTMGFDAAEPAEDEPAAADAHATDGAKAATEPKDKPGGKKADAEPNPIRKVHFSNFIIQ